MPSYEFDEYIQRRGTNSLKYDAAAEFGMPEGLDPFWVADMDFQTVPSVCDALRDLASHGVFGYSVPDASYYRALQDWFGRCFQYSIDPAHVVLTPGVVFAVSTAIRAFSAEGDGVLIQPPVYHPFAALIRDNGRTIVNNPLRLQEGRYTIDFEDFEEQLRQHRPRLFLLCSPHNPVGRVWTANELERLGELCLRYDCLAVSDEIHCDLTYPGQRHNVLASLSPAFAANTITCTAPSKTFNLPGLQLSNIIIHDREKRRCFVRELRKTGYEQANRFGLVACRRAYASGADWADALRAYLWENLGFLRGYLKEHLPQVRLIEPEGTYLAWLDFRALGLPHKDLDALIVNKAKLWLNSGVLFGAEGAGFQRLNIACPRSQLKHALARLAHAVQTL